MNPRHSSRQNRYIFSPPVARLVMVARCVRSIALSSAMRVFERPRSRGPPVILNALETRNLFRRQNLFGASNTPLWA